MKRFFLAALTVALALPAGLSAQGFAPTPAAQEYLNFVSGSGVGSTYGVQVGPYVGEFTDASGTPTSGQFALYCVDFLHAASDDGLVNSTQISSASDFSNTRLGNFAAYRRAAFLHSLFDGWAAHEAALEAMYAGTDFKQRHVWGGLHAAIWNGTTSSGNVGGTNQRTLWARAYFDGIATPGSFNASGWYVLTDANASFQNNVAWDGTGQEFLIRTPVPEPSTAVLMASGLLALVGVRRRRRTEIEEEA